MMHFSKPGTLEETRDGWVKPVCNCKKKLGVYPGVEDAADALMQHAYEQGILDERKSTKQKIEAGVDGR